MVAIPECDVCGEIWLPDKRLPDGSSNPARGNPRLSKRCGKCKTPRWNYKERPAPKKVKKKTEDDTKAESGQGAATEEWLG